MRVLSLFSGIGGIDKGLQDAGMTIVGQCENDEFCTKILEKHWPNVARFGDIRNVSADDIRRACGSIDIIAGGFPCQDISVAGKGQGLSGSQSGLWWEMWRLINELRPDWLFIENVPALRTRGYDEVATSLEKLAYQIRTGVVGAWAVGAPHQRNRVWIVANNVRFRQRGSIGQSERGMRAVYSGESSREDEGRKGAVESIPNPDGELKRSVGMETGRCLVEAIEICAQSESPSQLANAERIGLEKRHTELSESRDSQDAGVTGASENVRPPSIQTYKWPARPGKEQFDYEPPRVIKTQSGLGGDAARLSRRVDKHRLKALGNAVVPQVVELFGRWIMEQKQ